MGRKTTLTLAADRVVIVRRSSAAMMLFRATAALQVLGIATISNANDNVDVDTTRKRIGISTKQSNSDNGVSRDTTLLRASVLKQQQYQDHYNRRRLTEVIEEAEEKMYMLPCSSSSANPQASKTRRNLQYIPGIDPTQDDDLMWNPSYRYPEFEAMIETELSLSMPLSLSLSSTLSPVTSPAPTPCEYRKWYFSYTERELSDGVMGANVCTNGEYSSSIIGSMIYYDSVDDCCAQNTMSDDEDDGEECMKIDVCNPCSELTH